MKHIKPININEAVSTDDVSGLIGEIVSELFTQVKNLDRRAIKRNTWISIINDVVPAILKDGDNFDDLDRKLFRGNKEKILKGVLTEMTM